MGPKGNGDMEAESEMEMRHLPAVDKIRHLPAVDRFKRYGRQSGSGKIFFGSIERQTCGR